MAKSSLASSSKKPAPPPIKVKAKTPAPEPKKPGQLVKFKPKSGNKHDMTDEENVGKALPIDQFPDIEDPLQELCEEYRSLSEDIATLDRRRKLLAPDIEALLEAAGHDSIYSDKWVAVRAHGGGGKSISAELLLKNGVTSRQLEKSYVVAKKYTYVQVRSRIKE